MGSNIEPCPFCGSRDVRSSVAISRVICNECGASGPMAMIDNDAKEKWNKPPREDEVVELPKDADGVPIRVGDTVYRTGSTAAHLVTDALLTDKGWEVNTEDFHGAAMSSSPASLTHEKPDSLEAVEKDLIRLVSSGYLDDPKGEARAIVDRIRRLRKESE